MCLRSVLKSRMRGSPTQNNPPAECTRGLNTTIEGFYQTIYNFTAKTDNRTPKISSYRYNYAETSVESTAHTQKRRNALHDWTRETTIVRWLTVFMIIPEKTYAPAQAFPSSPRPESVPEQKPDQLPRKSCMTRKVHRQHG